MNVAGWEGNTFHEVCSLIPLYLQRENEIWR